MHQMKIAMSIDFDANRCGGKNGRAQIYQRIYQRFLVFPNELRCTLLSLKVLKMNILQKKQFISELPLCSPREHRFNTSSLFLKFSKYLIS